MTAIDYAIGPRQHGWLRRNLRRIVVVAICAAVGIAVHRNWRPIERYARWQYWHWQLSRYAMSPSDAIAPPTTVPTSPTAGTRHVAPPLAALSRYSPMNCLPLSYARGAPGGYDYVGQRRRPDGSSRTVVLAMRPDMHQPLAGATIAVIKQPGLFTTPPRIVFGCGFGNCDDSGPTWPALTECVDDPADASAILVSLYPIERAEGASSYRPIDRPTRLRVRLTNADTLDWTLTSHDPILAAISVMPPTFGRAAAPAIVR